MAVYPYFSMLANIVYIEANGGLTAFLSNSQSKTMVFVILELDYGRLNVLNI